ncbi:MAG: permease, partial [Hyphomicrobiales bacterium]
MWLGLFGGFATHWLIKAGRLKAPLRDGIGTGGCATSSVRVPKPVHWAFWRQPARVLKFRQDAVLTTLFLGKWLTLAFLLEALMLAYVPAAWVASALGGTGVWPVVVATLVGVPAYLNGYAALPLVSGLIEQGMSPGAGLAFIVAGGVSSFPAAIAVFALVKRGVFALYAALALSGSLVAGLVFHAWTL